MEMRKTYVIFGSTRLVTRPDRGAVRGEDRLEACEARGEGMLLRVTRLHHLAVVLYVLPGVAIVLGAASGGAEAMSFFLRIMSYTMTS
jgi:hypothetical protein